MSNTSAPAHPENGSRARFLGSHPVLAAVVVGVTVSAAVLVPLRSLADDPAPKPSPSPTAQIERSQAVLRAPATPRPQPVAQAASVPPAPPPAAPPAPTSERVALLVGINRPRGGSPLEGAVTDVEYLYNALRLYGFQETEIVILKEGQATIGAIRAALAQFAARSSPTGTAVFAWAGHSSGTSFATSGGERFPARELATSLGRVRSRMFVALPTCYSGAYSIPGIIGPGRVAAFSSASNEQTFELGSAGSYMMIYLVREAMIKGYAPGSVEQAFEYAKATLEATYPNRVPALNDQVDGEFVLGPVTWEPAPSPAA